MSEDVVKALDLFVEKYQSSAKSKGVELSIEYDANWPSDCYVRVGESAEHVPWQPQLREQPADFSGMEHGLDMLIHPDIKAFYSRYWSDNLSAVTSKGCLQVLQAWNPEDFERLQQNLVGHVLMKRRLKQPETLFFGLTDQEDFILTIDNQTGKVMLEQVGVKPTECLASNLAEYLLNLEPIFT